MSEHEIQNKIRVALSKHGIVLRLNVGTFFTKDGRRINSGLPKGTSDLLFIGWKKIAFIEVKNEKGKASPEQLRFIECVKNLGHSAGVCRSVEDALKLIGE